MYSSGVIPFYSFISACVPLSFPGSPRHCGTLIPAVPVFRPNTFSDLFITSKLLEGCPEPRQGREEQGAAPGCISWVPHRGWAEDANKHPQPRLDVPSSPFPVAQGRNTNTNTRGTAWPLTRHPEQFPQPAFGAEHCKDWEKGRGLWCAAVPMPTPQRIFPLLAGFSSASLSPAGVFGTQPCCCFLGRSPGGVFRDTGPCAAAAEHRAASTPESSEWGRLESVT